jgi:hypothetical protein
VFAAPKSLSIVAALAPPATAATIRGAHTAAVADTVAFIERRSAWARRHGCLVPSDGIAAGAFEHRHSAAGDPHLHSHVVVVNLVLGPDRRWSSLALDTLAPGRGAISAIYQLGLRHHLTRAGLGLRWELRADGLADVAGVDRAATGAASRRHEQIRLAMSAGAGDVTQRARSAWSRTRRAPSDGEGDWRSRLEAAGFGAHQAVRVARGEPPVGQAEMRPPVAGVPGGTEHEVTMWLAARSSTFGPFSVLAALAATQPDGWVAPRAEQWADRYCANAIPRGRGRWTTPAADRNDRELSKAVLARLAAGAAIAAGDDVAAAIAARPDLSGDAVLAVRQLTTSGNGVEMLGAGERRHPLLAQGAVLETARVAWEQSGHRVALVSQSSRNAWRWRALTGIESVPPGGGRIDVAVVDQADRATTTELAAWVAWAAEGSAKLVLVEGGTLPRAWRWRSDGLAAARDAMGVAPAGPFPGWTVAKRTGVSGAMCSAYVAAADAAGDLTRMQIERASGDGGPLPLLVGLGPAEVEGLNRAARRARWAAGQLEGPEIGAGGRAFRRGDRVIRLHRSRPVCAGDIVSVDPRNGTVAVDFGHGPERLDRGQARHLTWGWATTPSLAARLRAPALALADPSWLGPAAGLVLWAALVGPARVGRRPPELSRLGAIAASVGTRPPAYLPVQRPRAELLAHRAGLTRWLLQEAPPDPFDNRRRLEEDRRWMAASGRDLSGLAGRDAELAWRSDSLRRWATTRRDELWQWQQLGDAVEVRADLLARLLESSPTDPRTIEAGPVPTEREARHAWRARLRELAILDDRAPELPPLGRRQLAARHTWRFDPSSRSPDGTRPGGALERSAGRDAGWALG